MTMRPGDKIVIEAANEGYISIYTTKYAGDTDVLLHMSKEDLFSSLERHFELKPYTKGREDG